MSTLTASSPPCSLNEVLEYADDMEIDIPKVWDYLGEILAPALSQPPLPLHILANVPPPLIKVGKAADLVAKTLLQVRCQQSEAAALFLWTQSQLEWTSLGVKSEDIEEFVSRQVCGCEEGVGVRGKDVGKGKGRAGGGVEGSVRCGGECEV